MLKNTANLIKRQTFDCILLTVVAVLIGLGILILASVSAPFSQEMFGSPDYLLFRQVFWLVLGIILAFLAFKIRLDFLKKMAPILVLINLILLAMVFLPVVGVTIGGASRWLNLGIITFQPAEFLKLTFILYLAAWLSVRTEKSIKQEYAKTSLEISQTLIAFLVIISVIGLLLALQPDISTLGIIVLTAILIYFSANTPFWHLILMFFLVAGSLIALIKIAPYRVERMLVFFQPGIDPLGIGFHAKQALIAVGSGGIAGVGLGMGIQKFGFLPQPISDSIFAIFAEETGFIGALALIFLFLMFLWRGFRIAKKTQNKFFQLTAIGITSWIIVQAFVNIGSMIGLLPITGIPLPFISYGGSHLIAELVGIGILLNISKQT